MASRALTCSDTAGWVGWAVGALPRAASSYARQQRKEDPLRDLTELTCRLGPLEDKVCQLFASCDRAAAIGACGPAEYMLPTKCTLQQKWSVLEDALLLCVRELTLILSASPDNECLQALCGIQRQRVDAMLESGSDAVARLSALRWAVPGETERIAATVPLDDLAKCEREETLCRVEYAEAERKYRKRLENVGVELAEKTREERPYAAHAAPAAGGVRESALAPPRHWTAESARAGVVGGARNVCVPAPDVLGAVEALAAVTGGRSVVVRRCERLESPRVWHAFAARRELVAAKHGDLVSCPKLVTSTDLPAGGGSRLWNASECMRGELNERWLLCSVHADHLPVVASEGLAAARRSRGTFGAGLHLWESVARAAESATGPEPILLLCRAVLGRFLPTNHPISDSAAEGYDSVVANAKTLADGLEPPADPLAWEQSDRQFVLRDAALAYPQYVIRCER
eukprot:TRINITY_DN32692_c0_g1_i1.p1 TRINITY_DN32692_c0_g1~~TRINITY_DN32692_c0_g1_i1.p1  ORF type:complete len:477 (+),score=121.77 TRINITY_DN32692_c0_g1_i1:57-1433(+)